MSSPKNFIQLAVILSLTLTLLACSNPRDDSQKISNGILGGPNVDVKRLLTDVEQNKGASAFLLNLPLPEHPNTEFNEAEFVRLLVESISLTPHEKQRVFEKIPQLSQFQVNELIEIFKNEQLELEKIRFQY